MTSVIKGSPAEKGGMKVEDIVMKINNKDITSAAALRNSVYILKPNTNIQLTILRDDKLLELPITITDFKESATVASVSQKTELGIEVDSLTSEVARSLGYVDESGVVITKVDPGSAAALAGLKKGALILSINREKIDSLPQFTAAIATSPKGRPILFQIKQGSSYLYLSLRTE